ncbi:LOW QUALITY PROTEIN: protein CASC3-like [Micropterus salmoides]|uniref:LOW QUALITY PROTEIN: protein CASC3-like n=1 Tax=Micropterus salmoides TaxID=27706 RepID=UPI0018ED2EFA|nr:LOW QUALITY PROTEIN: protein CASC3-like [Micropterus salmoides]
MADRRRRRRRASQDSEDDDESGSGSDSGRSGSPATKSRGKEPEPPEPAVTRVEPKSEAESECESEDGVGEAVLSDYDSADPEENGSHSEGVEEEEEAEHFSDEEAPAAAASEPKPPAADEGATKAEVVEEEEQKEQQEQQGGEEGEEEEDVADKEGGGGQSKEETKAEVKGNLAGERQSGDGQESTDDPETKDGGKPGQKLDDDEDRKNPAYIPRKGLFFEHDVRGHTQEEERPKGRNRKLWKDEGRWEHDRFREEEQAPKSREELIAIYGYDIRNGGGSGDRSYRQRRPRQSTSPSRDKRWRDGGERPVRSWHSGGGGGLNRGGAPPPSSPHPSSTPPSSLPLSSAQRGGSSSRPPPSRNRLSYQNQTHPAPHYRNNESNAPQMHPRERQGPKAQSDPTGDKGGVSRGGGGGGGRGGPSVVIEDITVSQGGVREQDLSETTTTTASQPGGYKSASPRRQQQEQQGSADRSATGLAASSPTSDPSLQSSVAATNREASPPTERPVERKSYSAARRTRSRPADLGSKQPSVEESAAAGNASSSPSGVGGKSWAGAGDGPSQAGGGGALAELDQDVARLSLAGQSWRQSPTSYVRSEIRGLPNPIHIPGGPPQFSGIEEIGVGANRAKRYSSQRQRAVPEPAPPMHLGVMDGHYYEPMSYQGPIYAHGEGPAPIPPQGMLVQPEMHMPHPGLHPHQSGGPIANPALYGGPPVSLSPGQPQQLLPPPFYPPPGVMTFPYPTMYPTPQGQAQVTYGGVTYYDTMQQQAQPKPSPPRRTSQPVTIKPPPPELHFASE